MEKIEYQIKKDKDFIGKRYDSYTVEKITISEEGNVEHLYRVLFPHVDGEIDKINFDKLYFPIPITQEEWEQLSPEYRKAWCNGTLTKELCEEREQLLKKLELTGLVKAGEF